MIPHNLDQSIETMDRTFQKKITLGTASGLILFGAGALYCFWVRQPLCAVALMLIFVLLIEQVVHGRYIFTDKELIIYRGRLLSTRRVELDAVHRLTPQKGWMGLGSYLMLEYADSKLVALEPKDERGFVEELKRRTAL